MRAYAERSAKEAKEAAQEAAEEVITFPRSILKKHVRFGKDGEGLTFITPPFSPPLSASPPPVAEPEPEPEPEAKDPFQRIMDLAKRLNSKGQ